MRSALLCATLVSLHEYTDHAQNAHSPTKITYCDVKTDECEMFLYTAVIQLTGFFSNQIKVCKFVLELQQI